MSGKGYLAGHVYLDEMGHLWASDRETLHTFASGIGMKREWFQDRPVLYHYDLMTRTKRAAARAGGAETITSREMVGLMRNAVLTMKPDERCWDGDRWLSDRLKHPGEGE